MQAPSFWPSFLLRKPLGCIPSGGPETGETAWRNSKKSIAIITWACDGEKLPPESISRKYWLDFPRPQPRNDQLILRVDIEDEPRCSCFQSGYFRTPWAPRDLPPPNIVNSRPDFLASWPPNSSNAWIMVRISGVLVRCECPDTFNDETVWVYGQRSLLPDSGQLMHFIIVENIRASILT